MRKLWQEVTTTIPPAEPPPPLHQSLAQWHPTCCEAASFVCALRLPATQPAPSHPTTYLLQGGQLRQRRAQRPPMCSHHKEAVLSALRRRGGLLQLYLQVGSGFLY